MLPPWSCQCSWDLSSRDLIPVYVRHFQLLWRSWSIIASVIMEIMVLCISSSCRFWSMYIVRGDDHLCDILYHAYSWPFYSYVSGTAICSALLARQSTKSKFVIEKWHLIWFSGFVYLCINERVTPKNTWTLSKLKIVPESCSCSLAFPSSKPRLSLDANLDDPPCRPALNLLALGNWWVS